MDEAEQERFVAFATTRGPGLLRLAVLLCGDRHQAEDIVQSALASMFTGWKHVIAAEDPDAYARQVLVNTARRAHRRRRVREVVLEARTDAPAAGDAAEVRDQREVLIAALRQIPTKQREVVVLRYVLDLPERDVAALLQVSPGTVKSQAAKGLAKLRTMPSLLAEVGR